MRRDDFGELHLVESESDIVFIKVLFMWNNDSSKIIVHKCFHIKMESELSEVKQFIREQRKTDERYKKIDLRQKLGMLKQQVNDL